MSVLTKAIGIAALGATGYDTLATSNRLTDIKSKNLEVSRLKDAFHRSNYSNSNSEIASKMQKWTRNWYLSDNWLFRAKDNICSFTSSLFNKVSDNLTTFALGMTALMCGKSKLSPIKAPIIGKIAAALLGFQAVKYVCSHLFGVGAQEARK